MPREILDPQRAMNPPNPDGVAIESTDATGLYKLGWAGGWLEACNEVAKHTSQHGHQGALSMMDRTYLRAFYGGMSPERKALDALEDLERQMEARDAELAAVHEDLGKVAAERDALQKALHRETTE